MSYSSIFPIDEAVNAVESAGVTLQIGFQRRFDTSFRRLKQAIDSGELGEKGPRTLHLSSKDPIAPPDEMIAANGGLWLLTGVHDFDMARFLTGEDAVEVYAKATDGTAHGDLLAVRRGLVILTMESGCVVTIDNVWGQGLYDQRVEAVCVSFACIVCSSPNNCP